MSTHSRRIGQYELQEQLGSGSMAEVWKAFDVQLHRHVAIKLLHANLQEDSNFVARFEREARFIASLHHPNIVPVHDFQIASEDINNTNPYMVMEYVEGQTLAQYINKTAKQGNIPPPTVIVQFFASICLAVHYAHQKGMIHRDLKPANILLDAHNTTNNPVGEPILTDFGVAKILGVAADTFTSAQLGTPLYISPEQANGYPGNEHSDIYSLGVILYEVATGKPPFQGDGPIAVMAQHLTAAPPLPRQINPHLPPAFEGVILRCLAKDPSARFPNALSLAAAIAEGLNVPVPERLGQPPSPTDMIHMPTYLTPTPSSISSPGFGALADAKDMPTHLTPPPPPNTPSSSPNYPSMYPSGGSMPLSSSGPISAPGITRATPSLPPTQLAPMETPPSAKPHMTKQRRWVILGLLALVVLLIAGSLGGYFLFIAPTLASPLAGQAFFISSGQLNDRAKGITDGLQIDLSNVPPPPAGKSYHLWLLSDQKIVKNNPDFVDLVTIHPPLLLTSNLPVQSNNTVHYTYKDPEHNNLISAVSRLLITLEDAEKTPDKPSTDRATWKYYAQLPQELVPGDPTGLRGLDHIRHLYYQETGTDITKILARPGGLDIWVFRNTEKILEWALSARDDFNGGTSNYQLMHNQFIRILDALDGAQNVSMDAPDTDILVDKDIALTSLLPVAGQSLGTVETNPPGDIAHMELHLDELSKAPDASPKTRDLAQHIINDMENAKGWLKHVHDDAKQLYGMDPQQLAQPDAQVMLEDLATYATYAYIGQLNPTTNQTVPGILDAHYTIQKLAGFDITTNVPTSL